MLVVGSTGQSESLALYLSLDGSEKGRGCLCVACKSRKEVWGVAVGGREYGPGKN